MDDPAWAGYRERVWRDSPMSRVVEQHRLIEELLACAERFDRRVTEAVRALRPEDFRTFLDVVKMKRAAQFKAVGDGAGEDYQAWLAKLSQDVETGRVTLAQRPGIDRMISLMELPVKASAVRQLDPACPAPPDPVATGPGAELLAATKPLFEAYSALQPRVSVGGAGAALDAELAAVLAGYRSLRDGQETGSEDWKFLQWWCAAVTGSLARSAAIQRQAAAAIERFGQAADEWRRIGQAGQVTDCLARAAEVALADGADVDRALEPLIREAGATAGAGPAISRARLLARLAQVYLGAGDHFDAAARAAEAAQTLAELGFADPATPTGPAVPGVPGVFAAWMAADCAEDMGVLAANQTQARLSAVTEIWAAITQVRMATDPRSAEAGTALLRQLATLASELGRQAQQAADELNAELATIGVRPARSEPAENTTRRVRRETAERQNWLLEQNQELNRLLDEFARCSDPGKLDELLTGAEALEHRLRAENLAGLAATVVTVGVLRSDLLVQLGRIDAAAAVLAEVTGRLAGEPGLADAERHSLLVTVIGRAVMAEGRRGDFGRMSELCGAGIAEAELDRGKVNGPYLQDGYLRGRSNLYDWGVFAAQRTGEHELMLARSELAKARGVLGWAVTGAAAAGDDGGREDERAFHELTRALAAGGTTLAGDERARMTARRHVLWERLMTNRGRRAAARPAFSLAALQAMLAPDEAVITYHWLSRRTLMAATIDAGSLVAEKITLDEARRADLDGIAASIGAITLDAPWLERESHRLGRLLLPRQGRELLAGKQRLIVSPHRLLHQLPFHTFGFDGAPLAERFAVSYVPNLTSLLLPAARPADEVFVLGVSSFGPGLGPLANAGPEAAAVTGLYRRAAVPVTLLAEGEATTGRVNDLREQGALGAFGTLHLVTHGDDVPVSAPFDAGLYLADGKIDGLGISQWRLRADLVVLSACHSGRRAISGRQVAAAGQEAISGRQVEPAGQEELFGDEVLGLQAAFFAAGARQVLGALWPVSDVSGRALMCAFHQYLIGGLTAEAALRRAMLDVRDTNRSMFHWAPYKLVRLGRAAQRKVTEPEGSGHD